MRSSCLSLSYDDYSFRASIDLFLSKFCYFDSLIKHLEEKEDAMSDFEDVLLSLA